MKIIYAIFAHPDDCEIWSGGTLYKFVQKGGKVSSYCFYEISDIRKKESERALKRLSIQANFLASEPYQKLDSDRFLSETSGVVPDLIITHWNDDTHLEHQKTFDLALELAHYYKRYNKKTPILLMVPSYYLHGVNKAFKPEIILDISDVLDKKINAIECHESQNPSFILKDILTQNRIFGQQIKVEYGEGYKEYPLFGFRRTAKRSGLEDLFET